MGLKIFSMFKVAKLPKGVEEALSKAPVLVGLGPSAWPRIINNFYFPKFKNLVANDCQDNEFIRRDGFSVYAQKQIDKYIQISPITPGNIISTDLAKKYLSEIKEPFKFVVYKSMGKFEEIIAEKGWDFVGNKREIRDKYENKKYFKELLRELGVKTIPGENYEIKDLNYKIIEEYKQKYNVEMVVLQIAEATWGGGTGTFFIKDEEDYNKYESRTLELFEKLKDTEKEIKTVNVAPFITGISSSVPCCATKYGTFVGSIQTQLVDVPEVNAKLNNRSGVYSGHDWVVNEFSEKSQKQAEEIAKKFGDYIYSQGYKGIFGIDLITTEDGEVWPVECNPRETDAFPLILMLQMEKGAIPFQVFHNLEHLGIDYEIDFEKLNKTYKQKYNASQLVMYNNVNSSSVDTKVIKAGVYRLVDGEKLEFVRDGYASWHLENTNEFLITEDVNKKAGNVYDPHERMLRFILRGQMVDKEGNVLPQNVKALELIYKQLGLVDVEMGVKEEGKLKSLNVKRIKNAVKSKDLDAVDLINTYMDQGQGVRRPLKITWRMKLDLNKEVLDQIKSKKTVENIKYDLEKLGELGIEIKIVEEVNDQDFKVWYELYQKYVEQEFKTTTKMNATWLQEKVKAGKKVGAMFAYKEGNIIGGELFTENKKAVLGIGYAAVPKLESLRGGLTLLLDYKFLEHNKSLGKEEVSFGQDTNLYGTDLSSGLILYKSKLGFTPKIANKSYWLSTYIRKDENIKNDILFFGSKMKDENIDTLFVYTKKLEDAKQYESYLPNGITNLEIISLSDEITNNLEVFKKKEK